MKKKEIKEKSVSKTVEEILSNRPFIVDLFRIDAANYSGIARHILPLIEKKIMKKPDIQGVIMAVKRYAEKTKGMPLSSHIQKAMAKCDLRLKGNIVDFTIKRNYNNYETVLEVYEKIKWEEGDIIYIFQSLTEIAVVLDKKNEGMISKKVSEMEIICKEENLAMVTLKTPPEIVDVPGFLHYIVGLIASEGISIFDIASTYTDLVLIVKEGDGAKTYKVLFDAIKKTEKDFK
ncbi:MAG TPA: ACT domain-containing protein [archaeon]|nr:ACT domain-containing protein [archaeon]